MLNAEQHETILALHRAGEPIRAIARRLGVDRKAVARVISCQGSPLCGKRRDRMEIDDELLRSLHTECKGWMQRIHEKLTEEHGVQIAYSTLTQRCRELGLSRGKSQKRFHHVETAPGEEMQHDTTVYTIRILDKPVKVVASILYLRYSKMKYLKLYLRFCRYDMKCFLHEALMHFGCSARICVIDNTNLARLSGIGYSATIQHEMEAFSRRYGFEFLCHERGHSNRKAGNERCFWTTETNFLPGRSFRSLDDLNTQAFCWATGRMASRPNGKTGAVSAELFEYEKGHLIPVTPDLPGPTRPHRRAVDPYGC
ncbi:MAG: hypothetical protein HQL31_06075 [Planctomycetes bacterium]|nr:hypothetical protein [Planctomycetota bacterium]